MKILHFSDSENWDISKLLAAILHLGNVGFMGNAGLVLITPLGRLSRGIGTEEREVSGSLCQKDHVIKPSLGKNIS